MEDTFENNMALYTLAAAVGFKIQMSLSNRQLWYVEGKTGLYTFEEIMVLLAF